MDGPVRRITYRKPSLGPIGLLVVPLIATGCLADDPLGMEYGSDACDLLKASDASPSVLATYEPSAQGDNDDDTMVMDDEAMHSDEGAGHDVAAGDVDWLVTVPVDEFSFGCALPDIQAGSVVAIRFDNLGEMAHEAVVGPLEIQDQAEMEMAEMAEMGMDSMDGMHHDFPSIALPPGEAHVLVVELGDAGVGYVGCHVPGHWAAGMQMPFRVI